MIKTKQLVEEMLDELTSARWFHAVGKPLTLPSGTGLTIFRAYAWREAQQAMESRQTQDFLIESRNALHRERAAALRGTKPPRALAMELTEWSEIVGARVNAIAQGTCERGLPREVSRKYTSILSWILFRACVLYQFEEYIRENRLYGHLVDVLRAGHCVCGWKGEYPDGSLVIY